AHQRTVAWQSAAVAGVLERARLRDPQAVAIRTRVQVERRIHGGAQHERGTRPPRLLHLAYARTPHRAAFGIITRRPRVHLEADVARQVLDARPESAHRAK